MASIAIASRAAALLLAITSDWLLDDHVPSGALVFHLPPQEHGRLVAQILAPFTRWDAAHLLTVASDGWGDEEYRHAFFPAYPLLIRGVARGLAYLHPALGLTAFVSETDLLILSGVLVSNLAFIVAACCLHSLGKEVLGDGTMARTAALFFCVTPASVFFSTVYTESAFAASAFGGMLLLERGWHLMGSVALAFSACCRANGSLNAILLVVPAAARTLIHTSPHEHKHEHGRAAARLLPLLLVTASQVGLVVAPYVGWQVAGYWRVCTSAPNSRARPLLGQARAAATPTRVGHLEATTLPSGWCARGVPDLYAHVQRVYWGVGLFRYFSARQLPNFVLALPAALLCASASVATLGRLYARITSAPARLSLRRKLIHALERSEGQGSRGDNAMGQRQLAYLLHWLVLTLFAVLFANVQITTRLVASACPPFYWWMAHLWMGSGSMLARRGLITFVASYVIFGTVLHSNFYPWT